MGASVMWKPLPQQLSDLVRNIVPNGLKTKPVQTSAVVAAILPFTLLILFSLPALLLVDHLLQRFYQAHAATIDSVVADLLELLKLFYDMVRISAKHTFRVVKRVAKRAASDPVWLVKTVAAWTWFALTNPIKVAVMLGRLLWKVGQGATKAVLVVKETVRPSEDEW